MKSLIFAIIASCSFASCNNDVKEVSVELHDWECRYIIQDGYNQSIHIHYVNNYILNVDNSISFIGEDGLVWRIPYPYYMIEVNPKLTPCK
jgi:hypothetical protein